MYATGWKNTTEMLWSTSEDKIRFKGCGQSVLHFTVVTKHLCKGDSGAEITIYNNLASKVASELRANNTCHISLGYDINLVSNKI